MLKNKWKLFSIGHFFSNEMTEQEALDLFDQITQSSNEDNLQATLSSSDNALIWCEFENMNVVELSEHIYNLAESAQEIEEYDESS